MSKAEKTNKDKNLKENKIWVGKDGIVRVRVAKIITELDVVEIIEETRKVLKNLSGKAKILIDISTTSTIRSSQFRKRTAEQLKRVTMEPGFEKAAIFGGSVVSRTIASFVLVAGEIKNMKLFETEDKALKWLKKS